MSYVHALVLPLRFPQGIAPGEGSDYNLLKLARNASGVILRGSSLAGVLKRAWMTKKGLAPDDERIEQFFGSRLDNDEDEVEDTIGLDSPLKVPNCMLAMGSSSPNLRTHHQRNRHTKTVVDGSLYGIEACPPGTTALPTLWFEDDSPGGHRGDTFLKELVDLVANGLWFGGKKARGLGLVELAGDVSHRGYDLSNLEEHATYMDDHWRWRRDDASFCPTGFTTIQPTRTVDGDRLKVTLEMVIPRGQDLLLGDGRGLKHEMEPQKVLAADGRYYWRIPGASLRGLFRGWMTRLAEKDETAVGDSFARQSEVVKGKRTVPDKLNQINGNNLGWCFLPKDKRNQDTSVTDVQCPISRLFGSLLEAGRIVVPDCLVPCHDESNETQLRKHVAVDRITGGAAESMLFENTVLTSAGNRIFEIAIYVQHPSEVEVEWLRKTIIALDLGILRVGSSKSSGRLALKQVKADGKLAERVRSIVPSQRL